MFRRRCLSDFWFFLQHGMQNTALYEPLHRGWAEGFSGYWGGKKKQMLLAPRGHVKSNVLTIGGSCWLIARDPNVRILILSHKAPDAAKFMRKIGQYLVQPVFRDILGLRPAWNDYANRTTSWNKDAL